MKVLAPFVLLMAALAAVVYLDDTPKSADLVFVNRGDVFTLDPQRMSYLQDFRMAYALYEGLVRWDNHDFSVVPAAAGMPEVSSNRLEYTFRIREDARWSNGDPVTAHDFAFSWMRALLPDTAADYSNMFFVIEGAREFFEWRDAELIDFVSRSNDMPEEQRIEAVEAMWHAAVDRFHDTVGIRVVDDRTLKVKLAQPTAYFLDLLAFGVCYPVHRPTVEGWDFASDKPIDAARGWAGVDLPPFEERELVQLNAVTGRLEQKHAWARPERLVGNGPYRLAEWRYKRDMRMERNPHYHSPEQVRCDTVVAITIEDTNTRVLAFESGEIDWLSEVGAEYQADMIQQRLDYESRYAKEIAASLRQGMTIDEALAALPAPEKGERRNIHVFPTFGTDFYSFNCRSELSNGDPNPFHDAAVRRAFAMAVDKQAIVEQVTRLNEPIATTLIPRDSILGYRSPEGLPHDPERARVTLAEAGWIDRNGDGILENELGREFPIIDLLWTTNTPRYKWISLELKAQWERELGVRIELRGADTKFYKEDLKLGQFMIARGRWYGDYGDPTTFLELNRTGDGNNDRGFSHPEIDRLLDAAANEADPQERMKLLEKCEQILMDEEVPMLPLCQLVQVYMYEPGRVSGLSGHPRLTQYLWQMQVDKP